MKARILIFIIGIMVFTSCEKQKEPPHPEHYSGANVSTSNLRVADESIDVVNGRLKFRSEQHFDNVLIQVSRASEAEIVDFENSFNSFRSLRAKWVTEERDRRPEFTQELFSILNEGGVVQVGERIFKLNMDLRKVFIISDGDESKIPYLALNEEVPGKVLVADFDTDEAWTANHGQSPNHRGGCNENTAPPRHHDTSPRGYFYEKHQLNYRVWGRNFYRSFGIWKQFGIALTHEYYDGDPPITGWFRNAAPQFHMYGRYWYKKRCKETVGTYEYKNGNIFNESHRTHFYYQGTRALSSYRATVTVLAATGHDNGYYEVFPADLTY